MAFIPEIFGENNGMTPVARHPLFQTFNKEGERILASRSDKIAALFFHGYRINLEEPSDGSDRLKVLLLEDKNKQAADSPDALIVHLATELTGDRLEIETTTRRYDLSPAVGIVVDTYAFAKSLAREVDDSVSILSRWEGHDEHPLRNTSDEGKGYQLPLVTRFVLEKDGKIVIDPGFWRSGTMHFRNEEPSLHLLSRLT